MNIAARSFEDKHRECVAMDHCGDDRRDVEHRADALAVLVLRTTICGKATGSFSIGLSIEPAKSHPPWQ